jgi:fungal STAND N-terminal Goodbye domain
MSQPSSSSSTFQILFDAALKDYKDKTGDTLTDHPIAKKLETCESVDAITAVLQEQARSFSKFRENDGELIKALNSSVDTLCAPSISSALNAAIGLVVRRNPFVAVPCS